ncbi:MULTISPECIES: cytochrome c [unclassified Polaromonas]|uniref:c-type cytochrome n=1 Tax=unclassified Polaromonas TaxID=2638319 RepID=UPI0018C980C5|nr:MULTISPECIES: cytochrome c [unclassified Polaromonas]MBG6071558.1 mono/diheme cytochrome c family protein [Polaromonas sp. CG_9.7]MBG6113559.1 mono/diheme cytochrome c family protein [Polaromonas sp. CG_9.2]MDH6184543.1 mono/diheme cytochrome c family protein [Polaromonas sp. CG_23.6]
MKTTTRWALGIAVLALGAVGAIWALNVQDETDVRTTAAFAPTDSVVARGAYLARAGNCMACHTARGGAGYAGGLGIPTPFGTVFTSNLTPDANTGIGSWSPAHFWRAMHNGRSKSGRLLYPAFPYTSYTQVTREDSDAIFAFLRSQPAVNQPNRPHALEFPFNSQAALAVWRALYFKPGVYQPAASRDAEWNRGAYLVGGLGHCSACHSPRDALGGSRQSLALAGGLIPMQNWYAPSLTSPHEAGMANWDKQHIVQLLQTGVAPGASVSGPMAEVVMRSTQHLTDQDLGAMATYLKALPGASPAPKAPASPRTERAPANLEKTAKLYEQHCAQCHGDKGQGIPNAYPPLAGNRAVTMDATDNLVQMVLNGGFAPATRGNPRPFGMPPFVLVLDDSEVAGLISHIRSSWGNQASAVTPLEVTRARSNQAH